MQKEKLAATWVKGESYAMIYLKYLEYDPHRFTHAYTHVHVGFVRTNVLID